MKTILAVDDVPAIAALYGFILRANGYTVHEAYSGAQAIHTARRYPPDLILLDVNLPDFGGCDVCRVLRMDHTMSDIPIILVSAEDERDVPWRQAGGTAFLQKAFDVALLPDLVRRHLAGP